MAATSLCRVAEKRRNAVQLSLLVIVPSKSNSARRNRDSRLELPRACPENSISDIELRLTAVTALTGFDPESRVPRGRPRPGRPPRRSGCDWPGPAGCRIVAPWAIASVSPVPTTR